MFLSCSLSCIFVFLTQCFTTPKCMSFPACLMVGLKDTCCSRTTGVLPSRDNAVLDAMQRLVRVFVCLHDFDICICIVSDSYFVSCACQKHLQVLDSERGLPKNKW